jgi:hypothetical protein
LFTSHGIAYSHWRTPSFREGRAAYALDLGIGYNFNAKLGLYGLFGGAVGTRLVDKEARASVGHFAAALRYKRKYFAFLGGLGLAVGGVRGPDDDRYRGSGLAIPIRMMGVIPLPKELFLGIGGGYDFAILQKGRMVNALSVQLTFGRW